jgi:hypothetical protein
MNFCVASDEVKKDMKPLTAAQKLDIIKMVDRGERFKCTRAVFNCCRHI